MVRSRTESLGKFVACLLTIGIILPVHSLFAQDVTPEYCSDGLPEAQNQLFMGGFELAIALIEPCIEADSYSTTEELMQAYELLANVYIAVNDEEKARQAISSLLETDPDYGIRADAAGALGYLEDPRAFENLVRAFYEDTDWLVRFSVTVSLGNLKDPRALDVLLQALESEEEVMKQAAIAALGEIKAVSARDRILDFAQSEDWLLRQRLAEALGNLPGSKSRSALKFLAKDSNPSVAQAAQISLEKLGKD